MTVVALGKDGKLHVGLRKMSGTLIACEYRTGMREVRAEELAKLWTDPAKYCLKCFPEKGPGDE